MNNKEKQDGLSKLEGEHILQEEKKTTKGTQCTEDDITSTDSVDVNPSSNKGISDLKAENLNMMLIADHEKAIADYKLAHEKATVDLQLVHEKAITDYKLAIADQKLAYEQVVHLKEKSELTASFYKEKTEKELQTLKGKNERLKAKLQLYLEKNQ